MRRTRMSLSRKIIVPVTLLFLFGSFSGITHVRGEEPIQPNDTTSTSEISQTTTDTPIETDPAVISQTADSPANTEISQSATDTQPVTVPEGDSQGNIASDTTDSSSVQSSITRILGQVIDENTIQLDWEQISNALSYKIYRDGIQLVDSDTNSFTDFSVEPNQIYLYKVEAFDANGSNLGTGTETIKSKDTIPPNPPEELKETIVDVDIIKIDWKSDPDAATYQIYRKEVAETGMTEVNSAGIVYSEEVMLGTSNVNSYTDKSAAPNKTFVYRIEALDASSNVSQPANITVLSKDTAPPTAPPNLRLKMAAANQNHLRWNKATDNRGVQTYKVYRSINGTSFVAIATTDETHYIDAMISTSDEYQYKVTAVDTSENESNFGNIETVQMPDNRSGIVYKKLPVEDF